MIIVRDSGESINFLIEGHEIGKDYKYIFAYDEGLVYQRHGESPDDATEREFKITHEHEAPLLDFDSWKSHAISIFYNTFKAMDYDIKKVYLLTEQRSNASKNSFEDRVVWIYREYVLDDGDTMFERDERGKWVFSQRHNALVNVDTLEIFRHGELDQETAVKKFVKWYEGERNNFGTMDAIRYVLFESSVSNYRIHKETGIHQSTLGKYTRGETDIEDMSLGIATKIYNLYMKMQNKGLDVVIVK